MPAYARREIVDETTVGVYHCVARCVRRAFLCGQDVVTGRSFEHRKTWIRDRLETLAGIFAIDVLGYSVMGNHIHVVLRTRPDVVSNWSDEQVGRAWWRLFPRRRDKQGRPAEPEAHEWRMLVGDPKVCQERRRRLSSLSWFMRALCEPIARRANREDECSGRFFEGRFKCQALLDEAAILACSVYVDLNPIRARLAETPETSRFTSVYDRISARQARRRLAAGKVRGKQLMRSRKNAVATPTLRLSDQWLCQLELDQSSAPVLSKSRDQTQSSRARRSSGGAAPARASDRGFLPMAVDAYLALVDWTGRQILRDKRGAIPKRLQPILERLQVTGETWVDSVVHFGRRFKRAVGHAAALQAAAARAGKQWFQGVSHCRNAFA